MNKRTTYISVLVGAVCIYFFARLIFFPQVRIIRNDVIQGFLIGWGLAFVTAQIYARVKATKVNGWITMFGLGRPSNGMLLRGCTRPVISRPVNVPRKQCIGGQMLTAKAETLNGRQGYVLRFPPGGLPPNHAFWSITMGDAGNHFVANPINRYSVSDRTGLVANTDGSIDIFIQNAAPQGHKSNWLPAPTGDFILWLRVYVPGQSILDGKYVVPPVSQEN